MNLSIPVPGYIQSNQRAELLAVVLACLRDPRPLDIRSDSSYVCDGVASIPRWRDDGWKGEHSDLWGILALELSGRQTEVLVSWVKGHAKSIDIQRGRTTHLDKWGNDGADALAVTGASLHVHSVPRELVQCARHRKIHAKNVQGMMVAVLQARFRAEQAEPTNVGDRGSELGEIDTEISDTEDLCTVFDENLDDEFDSGGDTLNGVS